MLQYYTITILQYYSITVLQYDSNTALQHCSITALQYYSITILRYYNITVSQYYGCPASQNLRTLWKKETLELPKSDENPRFPLVFDISAGFTMLFNVFKPIDQ